MKKYIIIIALITILSATATAMEVSRTEHIMLEWTTRSRSTQGSNN